MLNKQLDDIMGVLKKKTQEETVGKAKHLRWVEEQIEVADKQKELRELERDFQRAIQTSNSVNLQEYHLGYEKLAAYFKSVSQTREADLCARKVSDLQHMMDCERQSDEVIAAYERRRNERHGFMGRSFYKEFEKEFEKCLQNGEGYLLKHKYDLCRRCYIECNSGKRVSKIMEIGIPIAGIVIVIILLFIAMVVE